MRQQAQFYEKEVLEKNIQYFDFVEKQDYQILFIMREILKEILLSTKSSEDENDYQGEDDEGNNEESA